MESDILPEGILALRMLYCSVSNHDDGTVRLTRDNCQQRHPAVRRCWAKSRQKYELLSAADVPDSMYAA